LGKATGDRVPNPEEDAVTEPERPPRSPERAEGAPAGERSEDDGRTPRSEEPAEGEDVGGGGGADTPGS
jgi:ribokinase